MGELRVGMMLLIVAAGCHTWRDRPITTPAPSVVVERLRVTTDRGARRLTLERATVGPDSVVGFVVEAADRRGDDWKADGATAPGQRVAVAAADVWSLEVRRSSWKRTIALVASITAVVSALAVTLFLIGQSQVTT